MRGKVGIKRERGEGQECDTEFDAMNRLVVYYFHNIVASARFRRNEISLNSR